jgi:excisionase family DNA binding protein
MTHPTLTSARIAACGRPPTKDDHFVENFLLPILRNWRSSAKRPVLSPPRMPAPLLVKSPRKLGKFWVPIPPDDGRWLNTEQAASYIGVHPGTLLGWVKQKEVPHNPMPGGGHHVRFLRSMLDEWARARWLLVSKGKKK